MPNHVYLFLCTSTNQHCLSSAISKSMWLQNSAVSQTSLKLWDCSQPNLNIPHFANILCISWHFHAEQIYDHIFSISSSIFILKGFFSFSSESCCKLLFFVFVFKAMVVVVSFQWWKSHLLLFFIIKLLQLSPPSFPHTSIFTGFRICFHFIAFGLLLLFSYGLLALTENA